MRLTRAGRILLYVTGALAGIVLLLSVAALTILPSPWFRDKVRSRIIAEVERATGGRVEVGSFQFEWTALTAEVNGFVLHGTESPGEPPLFRADSVRVGLKIVSIWKRDIDISSLSIEQPGINIQVDKEGIVNFPRPKVQRTGTDPIEGLLKLKIGEIRLRNGALRYGDQRLPLDLQGKHLAVKLDYQFAGPVYRGNVSMDELTVDAGPALPMTFAFEGRIGLFRNRLAVEQARLTMPHTSVEASGSIDDFKSPRVAINFRGTGSLSEIGRPLRLPIERTGQVSFNGTLGWERPGGLLIQGRATGQHLAYREGPVNLHDLSLATDVQLKENRVHLRGLTVHALDGVFNGMADIADYKTFQVNGKLTGVSLRSVARMTGYEKFGLSGALNGPVEVRGSFAAMRDLRAGGKFNVGALQEGVPVRGFVEAVWNGNARTLQLGESNLHLPSTSAQFRGTMGEKLDVTLRSTNLEDIRPILGIDELPLELSGSGSALFEGVISGELSTARATGTVTLSNFVAWKQPIDRVVAKIEANASGLRVGSFALGQNTLRLSGDLNVGLQEWRVSEASTVAGSVKLTHGSIERVLTSLGEKLPLDGEVEASMQISGTLAEPKIQALVTVEKPEIYGESFDKLTAKIDYAASGVELIDAVAFAGSSKILFDGSWKHPLTDWKNGSLSFHVNTENLSLQQLANLRQYQSDVGGRVVVKGEGALNIQNGRLLPDSLNGTISVHQLSVEGRELGDFNIDAKTVGHQLTVGLSGALRGAKVSGNGSFELTGDYPGSGKISFSPMTLAAVQDLAMVTRNRDPLPLDGFVGGWVTFSGPARLPEQMRGKVELSVLEIVPARQTMTQPQRDQLALKNEGTIQAEYDGKALLVRNAHLVGRETDLRVGGSVVIRPKAAYDLRIDGNLDLGVIQNFSQNVVSSGVAVLNGSVRGSLNDPQPAGRMTLKRASFSLTDFPNGLTNVSGVIVFDQRRANIEGLRANTGGGNLILSGFIGLSGREMLYQLQARADNVRIRYPEDVSMTANATLSWTGTTSQSLLTGVVTVGRASFNPRTDIGSILASSPIPVAAARIENDILRGMQFDVRVETVPNLQFQTSLTTDLQAESDLRLRGSVSKPVLLGRIVINQGEIQFFGNKYTINRGEIGFFNPVRFEPVLDLDLETRVRGVLVNINFAGQLTKLNVSYRSDPPLQSTDIVALLAIGRAPGSNSSLASSQALTNQPLLGAGGNSLLGQAVAAPISSRLQRFFGVSRLKIDPQLTGLSAVPQARLTIEQQISRDVTLTYVTNLAQVNQQIIRLEWAMNRNWSVVAVREENGVFGVDFFFKKRF